MVIKVNHLGE